MAEEARSALTGMFHFARLFPAIVGFSAITGQIVLLRELMVLANGNELSLGMMLAAWLAWNALGSTLGTHIVRLREDARALSGALAAGCGLSLPATILALRWSRSLITPLPTELLSPWATLLISAGCLGVFCALSGCLFSAAVRLYVQSQEVSLKRALGYVYLLETVGTGVGGILASMVFLRVLGPLQIGVFICTVDLCVAIILLLRARNAFRMGLIGMVCGAGIWTILIEAARIERRSQQKQWGQLRVIAAKDSIYGRITVTDTGGMRSIYEYGSILANIPDKAAAEEMVHYALLEHPMPTRVLLIGGSATGAIAEMLQYRSVNEIDVVELDPTLVSIYAQLVSGGPADGDRRVRENFGDGRQYLRAARAKFDVILLNVPDPETAQWNRFYTVEFFQVARERLASGGILGLQLRSSEEFLSADRAEFLRCILATMGQAFPHIAMIPGDPMHIFGAAKADVLTEDPEVLIARLKERKLQTQYVNEYFIPFRLSAERIAYTREKLQPRTVTPINRDFHPTAYYFAQTLWSSQFRTGYGIWLRRLAQIPSAALFGCAAAALLVLAFVRWRPRSQEMRVVAAARWSVFASGYVLITVQILVLLVFQSIYGYLYYELAMLVGVFMAGIALGSWMGLGLACDGRWPWFVAGNQVLMAASAPLVMMAATLVSHAPAEAAGKPIAAMSFSLLAFVCGIPGGMQFTIAAELGVGSHQPQRREIAEGSGVLYAVDLLGGGVGALLVCGFLVPIYGLWDTALFATLLSLACGSFRMWRAGVIGSAHGAGDCRKALPGC